MPFLAAILPALIGAGATAGSALLSKRGGGGSGNKQLDRQAELQTKALEQLLAELARLRGSSGDLQNKEQSLLDTLGIVFDFSGLPGLSDEGSAFLSNILGPLRGLQSVRPSQNAFGREASLAQLLLGASGGNAAGQSANLGAQREGALASSLGGAAGNLTQFLSTRSLLEQLTQGSLLPQLLAGLSATQPNVGQLPSVIQ